MPGVPPNEPMPPIWVISLERATERRENVRAAFTALGLPFEILDAVDGGALTAEQVGRYSQWRACFETGRGLGQGELGAALSHLMVYERMVREEIPVVAIFEDDVEPGPDLPGLLASTDRLPPDWQVVNLRTTFAWSEPQPVDTAPIADGYRVCTYGRTPLGAVGYLINLAGARRVLAAAYPVGLPSDELLFRPRPAGLTRYGIEPSPLGHRDIESEVIRRASRSSPGAGSAGSSKGSSSSPARSAGASSAWVSADPRARALPGRRGSRPRGGRAGRSPGPRRRAAP